MANRGGHHYIFGVPEWAKVGTKICGFTTDVDSTMTEDYDAEMEASLIEPGFPQRYRKLGIVSRTTKLVC